MTLKGRLEHFGLGELLQTLALNQHTGTLVLERGGELKKIYFATGSISLISTGSSLRIGDILVRSRKVTEDQVRHARLQQQASGKLLGAILVEEGVLEQADVEQALRQRIEEEIYDLFLWPDGVFEFLPDHCPSELRDPLQRFTQVRVDPSAVIMEGLRQLDEFHIIRQRIPDVRVAVRRLLDHPPDDVALEAEELDIWQLTGGEPTVAEILERAPMTRFATMCHLYRFIGEEWIRPLSFEEHLERARRERKSGRTERAAELYQLLVELDSTTARDADFLREAGSFLLDMDRRERGGEILRQALDRYLEAGDLAAAWNTGSRMVEALEPELDLLGVIWRAHRAAGPKSVAAFFERYTQALISAQRFQELEGVLDECQDELAREPGYWNARGEAQRGLGETRSAVQSFERSLRLLREGKDLPEIIRLLRQIYDLDSSRSDIAERLQRMLGLQAKQESRKRRRFTAAGIALIGALLLAILPLHYELQARAEFERIKALELAYDLEKDDVEHGGRFAELRLEVAEKVVHRYRQLLEDHPFSSRSRVARETLERYESRKKAAADAVAVREAERARVEREQIQVARGMLEELREKEERASAAGDYATLRRVREGLLRECGRLIDAKSVKYPLFIETEPSGAEVSIDGEPLGITPFLFEFEPGAAFSVELRRDGCLPRTIRYSDEGRTRLRITLDRTPLAHIPFPAIGGPVLREGEHIYVPARDGWIYSLVNDITIGQVASWRRKAGHFGHPAPSISFLGSDLLVSSISGEVSRVDPSTGDARWSVQLGAPVTAHAVSSADGAHVAVGCEDGLLELIDGTSGEVLTRIRGEFPPQLLQFSGAALEVVTRDRHVLRLSVPRLSEEARRTLPAHGVAFTATAQVLAADGTLVGETMRQLPTPNTHVARVDGGLSYGSTDGSWIIVGPGGVEKGRLPAAPTSPPLCWGECVYISCADGRLYCVDRSRAEVRWSMEVPSSIEAVQPGIGSNLVVFLSVGGIIIVEGEGH